MWQPHFRWYYGGCGSEGRAEEDEQAAKANHRIEEAGQSDGRFFLFLCNFSRISLSPHR